MLKEINWKLSFVILLISLGLLVGGYHIYQNIGVKKPLEEALRAIDGVILEDYSIEKDYITLNITLKDVKELNSTYQELVKSSEAYLSGRELVINFNNSTNSVELKEIWNYGYFYIAEAIAEQHYSLIPETIDKLRLSSGLAEANYSMDEKNIYITLYQGEEALYIVLPRVMKEEV